MQGGDAYNIIPQTAVLSGTARFFTREVAGRIEEGLRRTIEWYRDGGVIDLE